MTLFKISPDDLSVRRLQEKNKLPAITGPVKPVNATHPVQPSPENAPINPLQAKHQEPHRRHTDRRQTDKPVILDTRSPHDRRTKTRHGDDDETMHGIDEEV